MKIIFFPNTYQLERLASLIADAAQVVLASVVIPALIDSYQLIVVLLGSSLVIFMWILSLAIEKVIFPFKPFSNLEASSTPRGTICFKDR